MTTIDEVRFGRDAALPVGAVVPTLTGDWPTVTGAGNLTGAIRRRIATLPGEMVHRPAYGAGLLGYLERPSSVVTAARLTASIVDNVARDSRVDSSEVSVREDAANPERVYVNVSIVPLGDDQPLSASAEVYI